MQVNVTHRGVWQRFISAYTAPKTIADYTIKAVNSYSQWGRTHQPRRTCSQRWIRWRRRT